MVDNRTFQQLTEEFARIVIPKVWEREGRKVSRVAEKLSISPKKVRRILHSRGSQVINAMSEKVAVFDTTLRDGEQAAGTRLGSREKLIIARQLAQLRVDVIEAGYPASSPEDSEAVQRIAAEIHGPAICALSRAVPIDIEACGKALARLPAAAHPYRHRRL